MTSDKKTSDILIFINPWDLQPAVINKQETKQAKTATYTREVPITPGIRPFKPGSSTMGHTVCVPTDKKNEQLCKAKLTFSG